jgi:hypothetical protein
VPSARAASAFATLWRPGIARSCTRQQQLEALDEILPVVLAAQAELPEIRLAEAPAHGATTRRLRRYRQRVAALNTRAPAAGKDAMLGLVVALQRTVTVEVILADVQHRRHGEAEFAGALELETRQLQHVELPGIIEEIQRRRSQVAADADASPAAAAISPTNAVTVDLALEPVIPITGARAAAMNRSISPHTAHGGVARRGDRRLLGAMPGLTISSPADSSTSGCQSPRSSGTSGISASSGARPGGSARLSTIVNGSPRWCRKRATDRPVTPSPTTTRCAVDAIRVGALI